MIITRWLTEERTGNRSVKFLVCNEYPLGVALNCSLGVIEPKKSSA